MSFLPAIGPYGASNPGILNVGSAFGGAGNNFNPGQMMINGQTVGPQILQSAQPVATQPLQMGLPNIGGNDAGGWFGIEGLGKNLDTLKLGIGGLGTLAGLWNGFQQVKLARDSFDHNRGIIDTNMANGIRSFNLALDDKVRSRGAYEGQSQAQQDAHYDRYRARDERRG